VNPTSILGGVLAVAVCAYLASVYLVADAQRFEQPDMAEYFRRRAIVAAVAAGLVAFVGIFVLHSDAPYIFHGLTSRALPLVILSAICGFTSLALLLRGVAGLARPFAIAAVATVVIGWGVAQWPYILPTTLKIKDAAAPNATLETILFVFVLAALLILPSLAWLYYLDQHSALAAEGAGTE
jgi:cytochrome d ubiquinol oxidase subunit II